MTLLLILGGALVVLAIVLISAAAGTTAGGQSVSGVDRSVALVQALTNAPKELTKEYARVLRRPDHGALAESGIRARSAAVGERRSRADPQAPGRRRQPRSAGPSNASRPAR